MDEVILRSVNGLSAAPEVAAINAALSSRWMIPLVCGPLALWLAWQRRFWAILAVALAMGVADVVTARLLKPVFARDRPCRALEGLVEAATCGVGESFPSGHATVAFAFLLSAAPVVPRGGWWLAPIATSVALSRVFLGVHYPSDVVAGALVGALVGLAADRLRRRAERGRTG